MNLTNISKTIGTTKQNIAQTASRAIKKLFKNTRIKYKLSYLETYDMLIIGLNIYQDEKYVKYFYKHLTNNDKKFLEEEKIIKGTNY